MMITWAEVVAIDANAADDDPATQTIILEHVNAYLSPAQWGGESSPKLRLARIYLAAHHAALSRAGAAATVAAGPVISESAGGLSRTYAQAAVAADVSFASTSFGREYESLLKSLPARVGWVI